MVKYGYFQLKKAVESGKEPEKFRWMTLKWYNINIMQEMKPH